MEALRQVTIGQLLRESAMLYPARPAVEYNGQVLSYRETDRETDRLSCLFLKKGIRKGSHAAILYRTCPEAVLVFYALMRIGAVAVMLNPCLGKEELTGLLHRTDVEFLLSQKELCEEKGILPGCPEETLPYMILTESELFAETDEQNNYSNLREAERKVYPSDPSVIIFTSGTTGQPKAAVTSHFSRVNNAVQEAEDMEITCKDRICIATPMFHCFALSACVLTALCTGACLYIPENGHTSSLLNAVSSGKCTVMSGVPTLFHALIERQDLENWDLSSLRTGIVGGSMCSPELFRRIEQRLGMTLLSSLGQTEATGGITSTNCRDSLRVRSATVGRFLPHTEGKISEKGEICVRGYHVMLGYYGQPGETASVIDEDGWLHTGDLGSIDEKGNVHLTGRLKELIIRGGENISPGEIEEAALSDKRISACKAVGVPDDHYGEEICLFAVRRDPDITEEELRNAVRERVAAFKVPRYIRFIDKMPVSALGKPETKQLRAMF